MTTRILLVRHGETDWNRDRRVQGHTDIPLNDEGRRQARALAAELDGEIVDTTYSSDLLRARETAEILCLERGTQLVVLAALREKHFGTWEGLTDTGGARALPRTPASARSGGATPSQTEEMSARGCSRPSGGSRRITTASACSS